MSIEALRDFGLDIAPLEYQHLCNNTRGLVPNSNMALIRGLSEMMRDVADPGMFVPLFYPRDFTPGDAACAQSAFEFFSRLKDHEHQTQNVSCLPAFTAAARKFCDLYFEPMLEELIQQQNDAKTDLLALLTQKNTSAYIDPDHDGSNVVRLNTVFFDRAMPHAMQESPASRKERNLDTTIVTLQQHIMTHTKSRDACLYVSDGIEATLNPPQAKVYYGHFGKAPLLKA